MSRRITWQNVAAPDFSSASQIMANAGQQIQQGSGNIAELFNQARQRQIDERSSEALGQLAGITGQSNAQTILNDVLGQTAAKDRNAALNQAIGGVQGNALSLDNTRSTIANRAAGSARAAERLALDRENQLFNQERLRLADAREQELFDRTTQQYNETQAALKESKAEDENLAAAMLEMQSTGGLNLPVTGPAGQVMNAPVPVADLTLQDLSSMVGGTTDMADFNQMSGLLAGVQQQFQAQNEAETRDRIQNQVTSSFRDLGLTPSQLETSILNATNLTNDEKYMAIEEARRFVENNPGYFKADDSVGANTLLGTEGEQVIKLAGDSINTAITIPLLFRGDNTLSSVTVNGEKVEGEVKSGTVAEQYAKLNKLLSTDEDDSPIHASFVNTVNKIAEENGLPPEIVASVAQNSLENDVVLYGEKLGVPEELLRRNLRTFINPQEYSQAQQRQQQREAFKSEYNSIVGEIRELEGQYNILANKRNLTPAVRRSMSVIQSQLDERLARIEQIRENAQVASGYDPTSARNPESTGGDASTEGTSVGSTGTSFFNTPDTFFPTSSVGQDPSRSTAQNFIASVLNENKAQGSRIQALNDIGGRFGRGFSSVYDRLFSPEALRITNEESRKEAAEAQKWFTGSNARAILKERAAQEELKEIGAMAFYRKFTGNPNQGQPPPVASATAPATILPNASLIIGDIANRVTEEVPEGLLETEGPMFNRIIETVTKEVSSPALPGQSKEETEQVLEWLKTPEGIDVVKLYGDVLTGPGMAISAFRRFKK